MRRLQSLAFSIYNKKPTSLELDNYADFSAELKSICVPFAEDRNIAKLNVLTF